MAATEEAQRETVAAGLARAVVRVGAEGTVMVEEVKVAVAEAAAASKVAEKAVVAGKRVVAAAVVDHANGGRSRGFDWCSAVHSHGVDH